MKKILGLLLYGAAMFGVTAGLGMFMMNRQASHGSSKADSSDAHAESQPSDSDHSKAQGDTASAHVQSADASVAHHGSHNAPPGDGKTTDHGHDEQLPVAVRASPMSIEEIVRMGLSLKSRDETLRQREATLRDTESQQRLIQGDVESAQQIVENLLSQASDQRAAIEELVAKMNTQQEAVHNERLAIASDQKQLKTDREQLDSDRRQLEAEKTALAQSETDLSLNRKQLDNDRKQFDADRTKHIVDGDKLVKDREKWVAEVEHMNKEKQQLAAEKEQIRVERNTLDQDKRLLASTPGAAALPTARKPLDAETAKQNNKRLTEMLEGMSAETAAGTIKVLAANGESDMVVEVLVQLEQRKAAAILDALADEQLVSDLLIKLNSRNSPSKSAKK